MAAAVQSALATQTVTLDFTKETKNTLRFDAKDENPMVQNIYVSKAAFPSGVKPRTLTITITGNL